jgi:hypothetical protein
LWKKLIFVKQFFPKKTKLFVNYFFCKMKSVHFLSFDLNFPTWKRLKVATNFNQLWSYDDNLQTVLWRENPLLNICIVNWVKAHMYGSMHCLIQTGLPDFYWYNILKREKIRQMATKIQNVRKINQMALKYTNILHCKNLQNLSKSEFLFENMPSGNPASQKFI